MSSGTTSSERLTEALDAAVAEDAQQGRLDDAEIQRLVVLSRDASYQRTERVPVKPVEAFESRSLVSIAMDAQRRREAEMRIAAAAGVTAAPDTGSDTDTDTGTGTDTEVDGGLVAAAAAADAPSPEMPQGVPQTESKAGTAEMPAAGEGAQSDLQSGLQSGVADAAGQPPVDGDGNGNGNGDTHLDGDADSEAASTQGASQIDFEAGRVAGIEEGREAGLAEGHANGLEEGRAAGRAEASAQLERAIQAFEAAAGKLGEMTEIDSNALGESIHSAILTLASERAGRAIAEQPDAFADRIEGLLAAIRTASGQPVIHLNPGDLGSIQPLVETREKLRHCSFVAVPDLAAGDLTVTVGTIGIDDILLPASSEPALEGPASEASEGTPADRANARTDAATEHSAGDLAGDDVAGAVTEPDAEAQTGGSDD